jgi:hypothetical protein
LSRAKNITWKTCSNKHGNNYASIIFFKHMIFSIPKISILNFVILTNKTETENSDILHYYIDIMNVVFHKVSILHQHLKQQNMSFGLFKKTIITSNLWFLLMLVDFVKANFVRYDFNVNGALWIDFQ